MGPGADPRTVQVLKLTAAAASGRRGGENLPTRNNGPRRRRRRRPRAPLPRRRLGAQPHPRGLICLKTRLGGDILASGVAR